MLVSRFNINALNPKLDVAAEDPAKKASELIIRDRGTGVSSAVKETSAFAADGAEGSKVPREEPGLVSEGLGPLELLYSGGKVISGGSTVIREALEWAGGTLFDLAVEKIFGPDEEEPVDTSVQLPAMGVEQPDGGVPVSENEDSDSLDGTLIAQAGLGGDTIVGDDGTRDGDTIFCWFEDDEIGAGSDDIGGDLGGDIGGSSGDFGGGNIGDGGDAGGAGGSGDVGGSGGSGDVGGAGGGGDIPDETGDPDDPNDPDGDDMPNPDSDGNGGPKSRPEAMLNRTSLFDRTSLTANPNPDGDGDGNPLSLRANPNPDGDGGGNPLSMNANTLASTETISIALFSRMNRSGLVG